MRKSIEAIVTSISDAPILAWILPGFFLSYLVFFLFPTFLSASVMQFFQYIPSPDPIGYDLMQMRTWSRLWLSSTASPVIGNDHPPLTNLLFAPLLLVSFASAYRLWTLLTILCYVVITLIVPIRFGRDRGAASLPLLVFITGLVSYGFQFELERGQFDVIAISLALAAIWIYHDHPRYRVWAYAFLTVSVQLKVYPFVLVLMLNNDWASWRTNLQRILVLALVNVAGLFVLGPGVFRDFLASLRSQVQVPYVWVGNHSITAFVTLLVQHAAPYGWSWLSQYSVPIQYGLLLVLVGCLALVLHSAWLRPVSGIDAHLLLACILVALLVPAQSHDYTLSILAAPVAIFYVTTYQVHRTTLRGRGPCWGSAAALFLLSAAYASTLFSFVNKPGTFIIANNFLALMVMLIAVTALAALREPNPERAAPAPRQSSRQATAGPA